MKFKIGNKISKIVFMGHNKWACNALRAILSKGYNVQAVVCETDEFDEKEKENYQRFLEFNAYESLKDTAQKLGLEVVQPKDVHSPEFIKWLENKSPDVVIMVSYHSIIRAPLLEKFFFVNLHCAPLPRYRGRAPINWAIINNEKEFGITAHIVDEGIDTGPIICQKFFEIKKEERAIDVLLKALPLFADLAVEALEKLQKPDFTPQKQDLSEGCYFPRRYPEDGKIDWKIESSLEIYNKIRALAYPYPGAFSYFQGEKIIFNSARFPTSIKPITPVGGILFGWTKDGFAKISTRDGWLEITEIIWKGEKMHPAKILKTGQRF